MMISDFFSPPDWQTDGGSLLMQTSVLARLTDATGARRFSSSCGCILRLHALAPLLQGSYMYAACFEGRQHWRVLSAHNIVTLIA